MSNYTVAHLRELESAAVKPAVLQSEYHPLLAHKQQPTLAYCAAHRIAFEAYSSFGGTRPEDKRRLLEHPVVREVAHSLTHANTGKPVLSSQVLYDDLLHVSRIVQVKELNSMCIWKCTCVLLCLFTWEFRFS